MKLLALVPARGGSKRLPKKNIRELGGKPLIQWTIDAALDVSEITDLLVSTDSPEIAKIAKQAGAMVPWLRPAHLATDTATTVDVCLHALEWYEKEKGKLDGFILLQPTSPFRTAKSIGCAIKIFAENPTRPIVSYSSASSHPMLCYRIQDNHIKPYIEGEKMPTRSQDMTPAYVINGSIYISSIDYIKKNRTFVGENTTPYIMTEECEALDVDTEFDWKMAEFTIATKKSNT